MTDDSQLRLSLIEQRSQAVTRRANRISRKAVRARTRLPIYQPELVADRGFEPVAGVPATRGDCPTQRPCPHVRCRWHLFMEDADTRAGRPGLASVPRDERGLTIATPGHAGNDRPGTTLRPAWLKVRGLEVEREVKVYVSHGELIGYQLHEVRSGTLDHWLSRIRPGERVRVHHDDVERRLASAGYYQADGSIRLDIALPTGSIQSSDALVLVRAREVSSCALDLIDQHGRMSNEQVGDAIGRHRTLVAREVRKALGKAVRAASQMGMSEEDLLRGLRELGAGR